MGMGDQLHTPATLNGGTLNRKQGGPKERTGVLEKTATGLRPMFDQNTFERSVSEISSAFPHIVET